LLKIDYRQDDTFYCSPDDSFSDDGWNIPFEHDDSIRILFHRQNRSPENVRPMMEQMELVPIRWTAVFLAA